MPPAPEDDNGGSLKERIAKVFEVSLKLTVPDEPQVAPLIAICSKKEADYQCNNAMSLWSKIKGKNTEFKGPQPVGQAIIRNLPTSDMIESCTIAGPGFINVKLSTQWIAMRIHNMLTQGIDTWAPKLSVKRVVVDYSSPNIAKEMHVGHLRSTIIGDTIARMLEYSKVDVLRRNHVGDWGTQFGMLIEYLFERFPDGDVSEQDIGELEAFYKASKQRFDADENFKERARNAVVALQSGKEEKYRKAWAQICEISRKGFQKVYKRLGVDDLKEMGESFYNAYIPLVLKELEDKGLIKDDKGTQVIEIIEGKKVVATLKDGDYNSYIKDLADRCNQLKPDDVEWKILVTLQSGKEEKYQNAWAQICKLSQGGLTKYQCLGIHLEDMGDSLNNTYIPVGPEEHDDKGFIKDDGGDKVIKVFEGKKVVPIIVTKKDGGYNYASTDLAALWYRLNEEKAEWIIYVTDVGQSEHFKKIFAAAKSAGWLPHDEIKYPKTSHVGFGLVLGDDGKRFRTRCTEVVKLVDLLDEAKTRCKAALEERGKAAEWAKEKLEQERVKATTEWTEEKLEQERVKAEKWAEEKLEQTAEAVGYGAVKYADLKNHRMTNYTFNFDQMLNDKGNTAVYLLYAHARICKIIEKSGKNIEELKREGQILLQTDHERKLGLHLLQFAEVVEEACISLLPNVLCEYLYDLSETFSSFYSECKVIGSVEETSRLLLCEATAVVMRQCFHLLGITDVDRI